MSGDQPTHESIDMKEVLSRYKPDTVVHGYRVVRTQSIPEINSVAILLTHEYTGLEHLHIATNDRENAFIPAVRTVPEDSKGTTRILENLVLYGSKKFPCRDIFDGMKQAPQATQASYIGVSRLVDCTFYPVITQNKKDYMQWIDVLMDALYRPLLDEHEFMHEAWHCKILSEERHTYALGGVAYTESINFMMNHQAFMHQKMINALFPTHAYRHIVPGMPNEMLKLTHKDVVDYHARYYHPCNSLSYTYGDFPLDETLFVENVILMDLFPTKPPSSVPFDLGDEPTWRESKEVTLSCFPFPGDDELNYGSLAIGYGLEDNGKVYENFCLRVLSLMLLNGRGAIIPRAFINSEITRGLVSDSGHDMSLQTSYITFGIQRVQLNQIELAVDIITEALLKITRDGIDKPFMEATLRQLEITFKNRDCLYGLQLFRQVIGAWNHNPDPIDVLRFDMLMDKLKRDLEANPRFFSDLVGKYFIYNPHRVVMTIQPDRNFTVPKGALPVPISEMTPEQILEIKERFETLTEKVRRPRNDTCLPQLTFEDLPTDVIPAPEMTNTFIDVPVSLYPQATNGLVYFRAVLDVSHLAENLQIVVPLFCKLLTSIGENIRSQFSATVGGLNATPFVAVHPRDPNQVERGLLLFSYCLEKDAEEMFKLWTRIFGEWEPSDTNKTRSMSQAMIGSVFKTPDAFLHMAWKVSARTLHPAGWAAEKVAGFHFFRVIADAEETSNYTELMGQLSAMKTLVMNRNRIRCAMTAPLESMEKLVRQLKSFLESLGPKCGSPSEIPAKPLCREIFYDEVVVDKFVKHKANLLFPFPDHIMAISFPLAPYGTEDYAALLVVAKLLEQKSENEFVSHANTGVAVQPGGTLTVYSTNDPNPYQTIDRVKSELRKITHDDILEEELQKAKRRVYHEEHAPVPPSIRGMDKFLMGITDEMKYTHKVAVLKMTATQVATAAKKHLLDANGEFKYGLCAIGRKLHVPDPQTWDFQYLAPT